jgi:hypothetical protein
MSCDKRYFILSYRGYFWYVLLLLPANAAREDSFELHPAEPNTASADGPYLNQDPRNR